MARKKTSARRHKGPREPAPLSHPPEGELAEAWARVVEIAGQAWRSVAPARLKAAYDAER